MAEDFLQMIQRQTSAEIATFNNAIYNAVLLDLDTRVQAIGDQGIAIFGLPQPEQAANKLAIEYLQEISHDIEEMTACIADNEHKLMEDQLGVYKTIIPSIESERGDLFFLDAPGRIGKTFVINLLLAKLLASSGIAATLLSGGCTAHSCFKLPLDLSKKEKANCNISRVSIKGKLLGEYMLIIWDKVTMSHKVFFEALDMSLQDLRHNTRLMGSATVLLAGNSRQTLPMVPKGTRADEVNASIKSSYLWNSVQKLRLITNMRVQLSDDDVDNFSKQLLDVRNGTSVGEKGGWVSLPFGHMVSDLKELMNKVFHNSRNQFTDHNWLKTCIILAPKNVAVDDLNIKLLEQLPGERHIYNSIDTVLNFNEAVNYPVEFLNSYHPASYLTTCTSRLGHQLSCFETSIYQIFAVMMPTVLETTILTAKASGEPVFIPRIPLIPSDMPFQYKRL
uniref:ATP-dependent DNA helicase n=1 Tax=Octopus bimaculoides TaxID=37653 RepID=A0A0L8FZ70_OCTBM